MPPLLRRFLLLCGSMFSIVTFNFLLFHVIPGDPIRLIARSQRLSPEAVTHLRELYGLDGSLLTQYVDYLKNLLHGDLGYSYSLQEDVSAIVGRALLNTLILLTTSTVIVVVVGVGVGVFAGSRVGRRSDSATVVTSLVMWSLPTFWVGMLLLFTFGVWIGGLPISGIQTPNAVYPNAFWAVGDVARHLVLPTLTLAVVDIAFFIIIMRTSLVEVSSEDYMLTARGKGLSRRRIVWAHGVRNALLPVVTASVLYISALVGGAIQVEVVFSWPGMGLLTYNAVLARDYPVLEASFLVISVAVLVANFASDLIYRRLDPRVTVTA
jgi:peptide/nickel transport system permease protein